MALSIESPGVQIQERDLSLYQNQPAGTKVAVFGFAAQGPTEEPITVTSISEYTDIFGLPECAAERYLYHTAQEIMNSPAQLTVTRMPYGSGDGLGYSPAYGALVYPIAPMASSAGDGTALHYTSTSFIPASSFQFSAGFYVASAFDAVLASCASFKTYLIDKYDLPTSSSDASVRATALAAGFSLSAVSPFSSDIQLGQVLPATPAVNAAVCVGALSAYPAGYTFSTLPMASATAPGGFLLGEPQHITLSEVEYDLLKCGGFNWATIPQLVADPSDFCPFDQDTVGGGGLIIVDKSRTATDEDFSGYYITVTDNLDAQPTTDFNDVTGVKISQEDCSWTTVPATRFGFELSATFDGTPGSISEIIENLPGVDFGSSNYNDTVIVSLWKLRPDNNSTTSTELRPILVERFVGSLNALRKEQAEFDVVKKSFYIENLINNNSRRLNVFVNPYVSEIAGWTGTDGNPTRAVRVYRDSVVTQLTNTIPSAASNWDFADNLYSIGVYTPRVYTGVGCAKDVGNIPAKLERALTQISNPELFELDITVDAGLSTMWTTVKADRNSWCTGDSRNQSYTFNDTVYLNVKEDLGWQATVNGEYLPAGGLQDHFETIYNIFNTFAETTVKKNGGVGHLHIQDVLRQILVNGRDCKTITNRNGRAGVTFSQDVYWPIRNLFQNAASSYSATYAQWVKVNNSATDTYCWVPFSGWAAAAFARVDAARFPWIPVAGLERGQVNNTVDIALNPNQAERDQLYRIGVNSVVLFPDQGTVIWGQKTLLRRETAFNRINVRRLFLALEKVTVRVLRNFVFEPNTVFTRTRVRNTTSPVFDLARSNDGLYDYTIVCDERNNSGNSIDNNKLCVDFYVKPVKAAEFISATFIATGSSVEFSELI